MDSRFHGNDAHNNVKKAAANEAAAHARFSLGCCWWVAKEFVRLMMAVDGDQ
jgi:hypothetical protein